MDQSILVTIKKLLGIEREYTQFDLDVIVHINAVLMILTQLGVGPPTGFSIHDDTALWSDFIDTTANLELAMSYILLRVKMLFDPPTSSAVLESMNRMIGDFEWRINVQAETPAGEP